MYYSYISRLTVFWQTCLRISISPSPLITSKKYKSQHSPGLQAVHDGVRATNKARFEHMNLTRVLPTQIIRAYTRFNIRYTVITSTPRYLLPACSVRNNVRSFRYLTISVAGFPSQFIF
jgi:hypothetical protein